MRRGQLERWTAGNDGDMSQSKGQSVCDIATHTSTCTNIHENSIMICIMFSCTVRMLRMMLMMHVSTVGRHMNKDRQTHKGKLIDT